MPLDGAFSPIHWLIIAIVALLVLGPDKLPDAARRVATAWRELQQTRSTLLGRLRAIADEAVPTDVQGPEPERPDVCPTSDASPKPARSSPSVNSPVP